VTASVSLFWMLNDVFRDTLIYAVSASTDGLPVAVDLLSEVVLRPKVTEDEVCLLYGHSSIIKRINGKLTFVRMVRCHSLKAQEFHK